MVTEPPAVATPLTTPAELTVATVVLLLLHMPPVVRSVKIILERGHTLEVPVIVNTTGIGLTVTVAVPVMVLVQLPPSEATTVYTPGEVTEPKLNGEPTPPMAVTGVPP